VSGINGLMAATGFAPSSGNGSCAGEGQPYGDNLTLFARRSRHQNSAKVHFRLVTKDIKCPS